MCVFSILLPFLVLYSTLFFHLTLSLILFTYLPFPSLFFIVAESHRTSHHPPATTVYCIQLYNSVHQAENIFVAFPVLRFHKVTLSWILPFHEEARIEMLSHYLKTQLTSILEERFVNCSSITIKRHLVFVHFNVAKFDELIKAHHCMVWGDIDELGRDSIDSERLCVTTQPCRDDRN